MEQDKILKILNTVEVEVLSEKEYEGSYLCKIEDIEKGHLHISLPLEKGHFIPLRAGTLIRINVTQSDGVYSFSEHILRRLMTPYPHFVIKYPQKIQRIQRRNYVRLMLNLPIEFKTEDSEDKYKGVSIDLSGGGVFLITQKQLEIGQNLLIDFKLTNGLECNNIKAVVKRERVIEGQNGGAVKRNYGIEFVEIKQKLREDIISYLFELQRERRKNNKDF